jgi:predicted NAD/FAD-binding protein
MKIAFGKDYTAWNNRGQQFETNLIRRLRSEIARFGRLLEWVHRFEFLFIFVPIGKLLKLARFSHEFRNYMVFPLTALFFGTGNQTAYVSSAIVARVFLDPDLKLFNYDSSCFLSQTPEMFAFDNLEKIYSTLIKNSQINASFNRKVEHIKRANNKVTVTDQHNLSETFDEIVFACDAESALKILSTSATFMERKVLSNVKYFNDVTITHEDLDYMNKYYEIDLKSDQYFVRIDENNPEKIEMSFNLSNYQPQLAEKSRKIFQTIFLDDKRSHEWSKEEIKKEKIILEKWWRQMSHSWKHFAFVVPFVRFIQGKNNTWY